MGGDPLAKPIELKIAKVFDLDEAAHSAERSGDNQEEGYRKIVLLMMTRARVFGD